MIPVTLAIHVMIDSCYTCYASYDFRPVTLAMQVMISDMIPVLVPFMTRVMIPVLYSCLTFI